MNPRHGACYNINSILVYTCIYSIHDNTTEPKYKKHRCTNIHLKRYFCCGTQWQLKWLIQTTDHNVFRKNAAETTPLINLLDKPSVCVCVFFHHHFDLSTSTRRRFDRQRPSGQAVCFFFFFFSNHHFYLSSPTRWRVYPQRPFEQVLRSQVSSLPPSVAQNTVAKKTPIHTVQ